MEISNQKKEKILEQILAFLYSNAPRAFFTSQIAREIARDEEFVKRLLQELNKKELILEVKKNAKGQPYTRRQRWRISDRAYAAYQKHQ